MTAQVAHNFDDLVVGFAQAHHQTGFRHHLPVQRYVSPEEFEEMKAEAMAMGFTHAACGPFVW
jgi:lipoate synthase